MNNKHRHPAPASKLSLRIATRNLITFNEAHSNPVSDGLNQWIQAEMPGFHTYVVDFHLTHIGRGNRDKSFYLQRDALISKYQRAFSPIWLQTTCTFLYVSASQKLNQLFNCPTAIKWVKSIVKRRL